LEAGDTAGLETCGTQLRQVRAEQPPALAFVEQKK
jgi:hypothetical protein